MDTIEKIEKGLFNLSEFSEEQINFIKGLVKYSYNDGLEDGKNEVKGRVWNALENENN